MLQKLNKEHNKEIKKLQDQIHDLTARFNQEFESMIAHLQNHIKRNKHDLHELKQNDLNDNDLQTSEHKDISNSRQTQKRISVDSSTTYLPYSSNESLNMATGSSLSLSSNPGHATPTDSDDHESLSQTLNPSNIMMSTSQPDYLPFTNVMSNHDSNGMLAVDGRPDVGSEINSYHDDDDDRLSDITVISTSVEPEASSQGDGSETHTDESHSYREEQNSHSDTADSHSEEPLSHGEDLHIDSHSSRDELDTHRDEPGSQSEESNSHNDEPVELQEYRKVYSRITGKYRK